MRAIGADHAIDYTQEDVTKSGQHYDLIFDAAAYRSISDCKNILSASGIYVIAGGAIVRMFQLLFLLMTGVKNMKFIGTKMNQQDLQFLTELLKGDKIKSIIDKSYALSETADALRYLKDGHARGKVVIKVIG